MDRTAVCKGSEIIRLRRLRSWTQSRLAAEAKLSVKTLSRMEKNSKATLDKIGKVATALAVQPSAIAKLADDPTESGPSPRRIDVTGRWKLTGGDIPVRGHISYPNGAKQVKAVLELQQRGSKVTAVGSDQGEHALEFEGIMGTDAYLRGTYWYKVDRLNAYGQVLLQLMNDGTHMKGFYIARDSGEGSDFIFGSLLLVYQQRRTMAKHRKGSE